MAPLTAAAIFSQQHIARLIILAPLRLPLGVYRLQTGYPVGIHRARQIIVGVNHSLADVTSGGILIYHVVVCLIRSITSSGMRDIESSLKIIENIFSSPICDETYQ